MTRLAARLRKADDGSAAVEFALVAMAALVVFLGIIEFGRVLYMRNEISYAIDRAARKILVNPAVINSEVEEILRNAITFGAPADLKITFGSETVETVPFRTLLINYPVTLLIPNLTNNKFTLSVERRVPLK
jgi:Flp pilus assembly protein TadG